MVPVRRYKLRDGHRFHATNTTDACPYVRDATTNRLQKRHSVHIGSRYQALVPCTVSANLPLADSAPDKAVQVWSPSGCVPESALDVYTNLATEQYGYNEEQALGLLQWHGHDLPKAVAELGNFTPVVDEWTAEDEVRFENALNVHRKNFRMIQSVFPKKTISSLVKHYYLWKQTRTHTSLLQHRVLHQTTAPRGRSFSVNGKAQDGSTRIRKGSFCRRFSKRADSEKQRSDQFHPEKVNTITKMERYHKPRHFFLKREDIKQITSGLNCNVDTILRAMDREIVNLRKQVQKNKQDLSRMKHLYSRSIDMILHSRDKGLL
ncbi:REST corepressor 1-like [Dermacentor andersoni]|uniref:REST corepressor 1-like n=1 Tax=Dermacentor andersoni TaxID=34620 RepID=UPI003B3A78B8